MEYQTVESALKSCVLRDTTPFVQSQNHLFTDDSLGADDVFPVDDLLIDFSNEGGEGVDEGSFQEKEDFGSISYYDEGGGVFEDDEGNSDFIHFYSSSSSSQLAVPDDDLAELEWVSHFVEDLPVLYPIKPSDLEPGSMNLHEPVSVEHTRFPAHVPVKARSKRPRIARKENPSPSDSSSSSGNSSSSCLSFAGGLSSGITFGSGQDEPGRKRKANRPVRTGVPQFQRRCTHCQVQRTPQWRAGPLGPKTLCNACGVRYKSGRLLPEYRPACSPTFSMEIHSNSHRKVLEMRRRKDMDGIGRDGKGGGGLAQVVKSC